MISFSMRARVNLTPLLMNCQGSRDDDGRLIARAILEKIEVDEEESEQFEKFVEGQGVWRNYKKMNALPDRTVEMDDKEVQKLINLIKNHGAWNPKDDDWFDPLLEQLQAEHARFKEAAKAAKSK